MRWPAWTNWWRSSALRLRHFWLCQWLEHSWSTLPMPLLLPAWQMSCGEKIHHGDTEARRHGERSDHRFIEPSRNTQLTASDLNNASQNARQSSTTFICLTRDSCGLKSETWHATSLRWVFSHLHLLGLRVSVVGFLALHHYG